MERRIVAVLALLTACYRTTEWGATGEYRGEHTKTDEQQVGKEQTATFDESRGLEVAVVAQDLCRSLMLGDHLEQQEDSTRELQGVGWMVGTSIPIAIGGLLVMYFGINDTATTDQYGYPRTPHFSKGTDDAMIIGGAVATAVGITELALALALPDSKRASRWTRLPAATHRVFTSDDAHPCSTPPHPAIGVDVHVDVHFEHGESLVWDIATEANGTAVIDLDRVRKLASWCGEAHVTAKVGTQVWEGEVRQIAKVPVDQITDEKARALAVACGAI